MGLGGFLFSGRAVIDTDLPNKKNFWVIYFGITKKQRRIKCF